MTSGGGGGVHFRLNMTSGGGGGVHFRPDMKSWQAPYEKWEGGLSTSGSI